MESIRSIIKFVLSSSSNDESSQSSAIVINSDGYDGELANNGDDYMTYIVNSALSPVGRGIILTLAGAVSVRCVPVSNTERLIVAPVVIGVMIWVCQDSSYAVIAIPPLLFNCGRFLFG